MSSGAGVKSPVRSRLHSVKDLLGRRFPALARLEEKAAAQQQHGAWLALHLTPEMHARVSGVNERDGTLVVFAESAAWSARLRFALLELEPALRAAHPGISAVEVRVLPRS